jgi:hypothetical protein
MTPESQKSAAEKVIASFKWLLQVEYLSDTFSIMKSLNLSLQGRNITILNVQNKTPDFSTTPIYDSNGPIVKGSTPS